MCVLFSTPAELYIIGNIITNIGSDYCKYTYNNC